MRDTSGTSIRKPGNTGPNAFCEVVCFQEIFIWEFEDIFGKEAMTCSFSVLV